MRFKFTQVLINAKLQSYFLEYALINVNQGTSNFLMVLNHCGFHLYNFNCSFLIKRNLKGVFFCWESNGKLKVSVSKLFELQKLYSAKSYKKYQLYNIQNFFRDNQELFYAIH